MLSRLFQILSLFFLLASCVQKDGIGDQKTTGRFNGDSVMLSFPSAVQYLNIGSSTSIVPTALVGQIAGCGIKFGTPSLPAGLSIDNNCVISGTPALLTSQYTYTITAVSKYNTSYDATISIVVGTFYNLSGTVSGLHAGENVTISNGADTTLVTSNTNFTLTPVSSGTTYNVTAVPSDSSRFSCTVSNGSGTMNMHVNNVSVVCASSGNRSLSGSISGVRSIDGSVTIQNNGTGDISKNTDSSFSFGSFAVNSSYNITISSKPPGYNCTITNGSGTLSDNISNVSIVCVPPSPLTISVNVKGLNSGSFSLQNSVTKDDGNSENTPLSISSNGIYTFSTLAKYNTSYSVTKVSDPTEHICTITNGTGTGTATANVSNIDVDCTANTYSVGGTITGLTSGDTIKFYFNDTNNPTEITHSYDTDGSTYTLPRNFQFNRQYRIVLSEVPNGKKCSFSNGTGSTQGFISGNVSNVDITCTAREAAACEFGHSNYVYPGNTVNDLVCDGSHLYVAGNFLGQFNQNGTLSELNSSLLNDYKQSFKVEGGSVTAIADDGQGGVYVGGAFTKVNGVSRTGIAHLYYDGSLDNNFSPTVSGRVRKIVVYNNFLYIGGDFSNVSGTSRGYFAKLNRHTGALDNLNLIFNNGFIYDMTIRGSKMMIGGAFTTINSSYVRPCLAEIDLSNDTITSFMPSFTGGCSVYSLDKDSGDNLYVGGNFSNAMGVAGLNYLFKLSNTNVTDTSIFNPSSSPNGYVSKIKTITESSTSKLLVGGSFSTIFSTVSGYISKINLNTNSLESISGPSNAVFSFEEDSNYFYAVDYNAKIVKYSKGASATPIVSLVSDNRNNSFESSLKVINNKLLISSGYSTSAYSASASDGISYLYRYNLNTGRVDTSFDLGINYYVNSIIKSGNSLYVGGQYTGILSQSVKRYLTKIDLSSTPALDSNFSANLNSDVSKIHLVGADLITLGSFTIVDSISRKYLVSLNSSTGSFRSIVDSTNYTSKPNFIESDGTSVYISNNARTEVRKYFINNPFALDSSFSSGTSNYIYSLKYKNGFLYITGASNSVVYNSISTGKYIIRVNSSTGARDTTFIPSTGYGYGIPFIDQALQYLYLPYGSTIYRVGYSTGASTTYTPASYSGVSSFSSGNAYIEGTNFYIMGGNFGNGNYGQTANLMMLPK